MLSLVCMTLLATLESFELYRFTQAASFAIAIVGINLLTGQSGQFSIGHGAFFAVGGYTVAVAVTQFGCPPALALVLTPFVGFVVGCGFGWPALRLSTVHLTLATWGLALAVPQLLKSSHLERWTGGVQGIYIDRPAPPAWFSGSEDAWWFVVASVLLAIVLVLVGNIVSGRLGRTWGALREAPIAAQAIGINVAREKTLVFGLSVAVTALGGGLSALLTDFIAPDSYTVFFGILLLVGAVLGGVHSVWGAVVGGLLVEFGPDLAHDASASLSFPLFGVLLILAVWLAPRGLAPLVERFLSRKSGGDPQEPKRRAMREP